MKRLAVLLAAVIVGSAGCGGAAPSGPAGGADLAIADVPRASASPADAVSAAAAINAFGFDLYRAIAADGTGDLVASPASVAIALAMARAGARGETAAQMDAVLRSVGTDGHAAWINALDQALADRSGTFKDAEGKDVPVTLRIANAPFAQRDTTFEPAFLDALAARFGAGIRLVDYRAATEAARSMINAWVDDRTEGRIPELLAPGDIDTMTRLVLVNAIYLKAAWQTPFDEAATKPAPFIHLDGSTAEVATMAMNEAFPYAAGDGWRAVELPYVGGSLAMTIVVPDDLAAFEAGLTDERFAAITAALTPAQVDLTLPKFGIETRTDLAATLSALGMPLAFDRVNADFSGMTREEALYISAVIHQANIDVDEKGTEAAAATAVVMRAMGIPGEPVVLHIDRPFLFALRDVPTGAVLFLGRVTEPTTR